MLRDKYAHPIKKVIENDQTQYIQKSNQLILFRRKKKMKRVKKKNLPLYRVELRDGQGET